MLIYVIAAMGIIIYLIENRRRLRENFKTEARKSKERDEIIKNFYSEEPSLDEIDPNIVYKNKHKCQRCRNEVYIPKGSGISSVMICSKCGKIKHRINY